MHLRPFFIFIIFTLFLTLTRPVFSANFISGSDTLSNPNFSQQSIHTISVTTTQIIPADGDILLTIPAVNTANQGNDGLPDSSSTAPFGGFDLNNLSASDIVISSQNCANNWAIGTITPGTSDLDHTIRFYQTSGSCPAGSIFTITLGDTDRKMINPGPLTTPSSSGKADTYTLHIRSRDGSGNKLDQLDVRVAIISPTSVSATIGETFSFELSGVPSATKTCDVVTDTATTANSVPWGSISKPFAFRNAAHLLTVSTNSKDGFVVTVFENDQLKRSNALCAGPSPNNIQGCIPDTRCDDGKCTDRYASDWTNPRKDGFGYSLDNVTQKDALFLFNDNGAKFSARSFPDNEAGKTPLSILSGSKSTMGSSAHVCYRIGISDTQSAGFYTNRLTYTASPRF